MKPANRAVQSVRDYELIVPVWPGVVCAIAAVVLGLAGLLRQLLL